MSGSNEMKDMENVLPTTFTIETMLGCNLRCPECAIGGKMIHRKNGYMSFEQFKIVADKVRPYVKYFYLHNWGEPLLNPDIFKIIQYSAQFTRTNISTNALLLDQQKADALIASGVSDIIVSIDGVSQPIYEQYRVGGDVQKAFAGLEMLQRARIKFGSSATLTPQFIVFKHNQHEMAAFEAYSRSIGLRPSFKSPYIRNVNSRYQKPDDGKFHRPVYEDLPSLRRAMSACAASHDVFTMLLDGTVVSCCHDYDGVTNFGNIFEQDFLEIWNSQKYRQFRKDLANNNAQQFCIDNCMTWFLKQDIQKDDVQVIASDEHILIEQDYAQPVDLEIQSEPETNLRFMQLDSYYEHSLNSFYASHTSLSDSSFDEHIQSLVKNGYATVHSLAPYLGSIGYETLWTIGNCKQAQYQWAKENKVEFKDPKHWVHEIAAAQVETFKPDILYTTNTNFFDTKFIQSLSYRPRLVMAWRAADIHPNIDWSGFDLVLSALQGILEAAKGLGVKSTEFFLPGFPQWIYEEIKDIEPSYDVTFCGQWTTAQHTHRNELLRQVAIESGKDPAYSCGFYLSGQTEVIPPEVARFNQGERFGMQMYRALRSGKIGLDARGDIRLMKKPGTGKDIAGKETANMRIFETVGCGVFLLTQHFDNLSNYFETGKEIETFSDEKELVEKIRYYLAHPDEREEIAQRGRERCMRDYSMEKCLLSFDSIIRKHIKPDEKTSAKRAIDLSSENIPYWVAQTADAIQFNQIDRAFQIIDRIKALRTPYESVDYLRAICFIKTGQFGEAKEALIEELRFFPDNPVAKNLLQELQTAYPDKKSSLGQQHPEFGGLLETIKPYTMLSDKRLFSIYQLARQACLEDIPGNFVECGVAGGGSSALIAAVIKKYSSRPRKLFSFDSYEGLPVPTQDDVTAQGVNAVKAGWGAGTCAAPEESLMEVSRLLGVEDIVQPVKGFFENSLPENREKVGEIAFMHMDADWYESTKSILDNLFDQINPNGIVQADDYEHWAGCKKAFSEFMQNRHIILKMQPVDGTAVWFRKSGEAGFDVSAAISPTPLPSYTAPTGATLTSPLTGSTNISLEQEISTSLIIQNYQSYRVDVDRFFTGLDKIQIYRCNDTGYRFYYPFNVDGDSDFYTALEQHDWYYMDWKWEHQVAREMISPGQKILEIGCARGGFLERMQQDGCDCTGLELNTSAIQAARSRGINVLDQTIQQHAKTNPEKYDIVCSYQVVEHIAAIREYMQASIDTLKTGGKLIFSVPNNDAIMFRFNDRPVLNWPPHHMGLWNLNSLISLCRIFPLRLDAIQLEPLQSYHYDLNTRIIVENLVKRYGAGNPALQATLQNNKPFISMISQFILQDGPGHTILAAYSKV